MTPNVLLLNVFFFFCIISCGNSIEFDNFYVEVTWHFLFLQTLRFVSKTCFQFCSCRFVQKSGHSKVKPGEIAIVFCKYLFVFHNCFFCYLLIKLNNVLYFTDMTVANSGINSKKIHSKNTKCCWMHPDSGSKHDCEVQVYLFCLFL